MSARPTVAVVVCAYTERRWADLVAGYTSLLQQTVPVDEILIVIDHNDTLLERAHEAFGHARVVPSDGPRGLSGARNTGVEAATADVVLFLDDDAEPAADWVEELVRPFGNAAVTGVAGRVDARWDAPGRPVWFPQSFAWTIGCSYTGLPEGPAPVRNPIGAAMGFRREVFDQVGGFSTAMGRVGDLPVGCEETEFAIRLRQSDPETLIVQVPAAGVHHRVPAERGRISYFLRRCYHEGRSKRAVARLVGAGDGLSAERGHALKVLPREALAGVGRTLRTGRPDGLLTAVAIVAGLAATVVGYLRPLPAGGQVAVAEAPAVDRPRPVAV